MKTSERELLGLASATAVGMGYPHGVSEELAKAVVWLVQRSNDGLGALIDSVPRHGEPPDIAAGTMDGVHVGSDGPAILDVLLAPDRPPLRLRGLDSPLLLVGLCGSVASRTGANIRLRLGQAGGVVLAPDVLLAEVDDGAIAEEVEILCEVTDESTEDRSASIPAPIRLIVADHRWVEAELLAAKTYVPASEESRHHGAGAGLTDND